MSTNGNAAPTDTYDVVVIGGGPPGENAAQYAIQGTDRTAVIVEKELVGGECSYWACMPSKALLRPWEVLDNARHLPGVQSLVGDKPLDVRAVLARRDSITSVDSGKPFGHDDGSQVRWANGAHIDVVRGTGRLAGERTVTVTAADGTERTLHARHAVVLATGTTAAVPPVPGLREALPWTSRDVTNLHQVPGRIAVIGGGVVACEAATWLRALGAEVTIIGSAPRLLARNEPFAGDLVAQRFSELGIDVRLGASVDAVERPAPEDTGVGHLHGGPVTVRFGGDSVEVDEVLIAAGRIPASSDIGLDTVGLADATADSKGYLPVDDQLAVVGATGQWLYAIGDLNGRALLTHMGKYQARIAGTVIAARAEGRPSTGPWCTDRADHGIVPQVTFTDPQVGSVGHTEKEARDAGLDVETVEYDMASLSGTYLQRDDYRGRAQIVIDTQRDVLVGATFVGPEIADLVHAATVAIVGEVPLPTLWHAVPSYPTPSEIWLRLLETRYNPS
ncbi:SidA/IucD/PvdA family monooxygenase [Nakamurella sp. YIM 132087]|uniref:SidA/IucD/PvdA family monooxygenase n=1 Tax=Nakamurella alba TaxID=2665158 RepID=A0A7K1FNP8_9ACTN|nr:NAD(P)/FAD-dependent oxidoreductase [Nakamurella alba]MTD15792.1 SidA/IucD/PvdA family monooxygenase [Nakamurella alba]